MALDPARAATRLAVRPWCTPDRGTVLVACSGGADSLALVAAAVFEGHRAGVRVIGAVVDHGLQDGSEAHTDRVVAQLAGLGVDETATVRVTVDPGAGGIEAGAREARYAALAQLAEHLRAPLVLVGHTRDDQAETVLLGLARGSGGRSLQGMRRSFREGDVVFARPLLDLTRAQTEAACRADGIEWWADPHNDDPRFLRSRVRHSVLPVLERELGPGVAEALARTGELLREDTELLDSLAEAAYSRARVDDGLDLAALDGTAPALVSRCVRRACLEAGALPSELTHAQVRAVVALAPGKEAQLPGHVTAYRSGGVLRFRRTDPRTG
ncbi:MAG: tRNA lysidine(34) synthetase TilS [Marmoricola sp.]|nr:tRNA lysidine(34) synthetase TilS [Marmoricola sp.]